MAALKDVSTLAVVPATPMQEIAAERSAAQAALAEAEQRMKAGSRDPDAFRKAKAAREAAVDALERLEWAEQAERERQAGAEQQAKVDAMREAQALAMDAHERAKGIASDISDLVIVLISKVKVLQEAQAQVERGVRYETFGRRDGYLDRQTVPSRIKVDGDLAVRIIRAGRELAVLSGVPAESAEIKAAQGRL